MNFRSSCSTEIGSRTEGRGELCVGASSGRGTSLFSLMGMSLSLAANQFLRSVTPLISDIFERTEKAEDRVATLPLFKLPTVSLLLKIQGNEKGSEEEKSRVSHFKASQYLML